jgi:N-acetylmuramic acid 6-phosphate etherase
MSETAAIRGDGGEWAALATERRNPRSAALDRLSTRAVVELILDEDQRALAAARRQARTIARGATLLARVLAERGHVVFAGAGTSGRLGVLEAAECPPTFGVERGRLRGEMAGGPSAVFQSKEGAEDDPAAGARVGARLSARDVLVGISASSVTPYVAGAVAAARGRGAATVLVTCARRRGLNRIADVVICVETGPEVLTGSTRMKAGSATKAVLNALTTAAMVKLGKTYENLMVDLQPTSAKLRDRSRRVVEAVGRVATPLAEHLLKAADGEVKTAIVMARLGLGARDARARLKAAQGHLRRVIEPA